MVAEGEGRRLVEVGVGHAGDGAGAEEPLAAQNDISFNQLVVQCCEYALENLGDKEKNGSQ